MANKLSEGDKMKGLFAFVLSMFVPTIILAQTSTIFPPANTALSPTQEQSSALPTQPGDADSSAQASNNKPPSNKYGSSEYGYRADVFVTGFGVFANHVNSNGIAEQMTDSAGVSAGYTFHLNSSSALQGRYSFTRDSDKYTINGAVSSIPAYFSEISGSYVYSFRTTHQVQPFLEAGGGIVLFSPGKYTTSTSTTTGSPTSGTPMPPVGPYAMMTPRADQVSAPIYTGSSPGIGSQVRGMFLYGAGVDMHAVSHLYVRLEFRSLGFKAPDYKLSALHTNAFNFVYEPTLGFVWRF
jgi:opacity protein-like surface antigen